MLQRAIKNEEYLAAEAAEVVKEKLSKVRDKIKSIKALEHLHQFHLDQSTKESFESCGHNPHSNATVCVVGNQ